MKILIVGDIHISSYSSILRGRGEKYSTRLEKCIQSINWCEQISIENNCDMEIFLGDTFNKPDLQDEVLTAIKDINWNSTQKYFIVGNHESTEGDLKYSSVKVFESKNRKIVSNPSTIFTDDNLVINCLPYITEINRQPIESYFSKFNDKKTIIFSHNDIAGIQMGPVISKAGFSIDEILQNCNMFINGHLHNGTWVTKNRIRNLGILTGQNFSEDASKYPHNIMILDTDTMTFEDFENPFAFNFYKLELDTKADLKKLYKLKDNAVLYLSCCNELKNDLAETLSIPELSGKVIESRTVFYSKITDQSTTTNDIVELQCNHRAKFRDFILEALPNTEVLLEELAIICAENEYEEKN